MRARSSATVFESLLAVGATDGWQLCPLLSTPPHLLQSFYDFYSLSAVPPQPPSTAPLHSPPRQPLYGLSTASTTSLQTLYGISTKSVSPYSLRRPLQLYISTTLQLYSSTALQLHGSTALQLYNYTSRLGQRASEQRATAPRALANERIHPSGIHGGICDHNSILYGSTDSTSLPVGWNSEQASSRQPRPELLQTIFFLPIPFSLRKRASEQRKVARVYLVDERYASEIILHIRILAVT